MFYSPFSQPTNYVSPTGKGIYFKPTSDDAKDGWGEPRVDKDGNPITPGTKGGPFPYVLVNKQKGAYKVSANKARQTSGNISWWGERISPDTVVNGVVTKVGLAAKGRYVLSYKGPKLRYFKEEGFSYGSDNSHNEIYYLGCIAAVAPYPVLGAAFKKITYYDPPTQKSKQGTYLYVACSKDGGDVFYRKRWDFAFILPYKMTDEVRRDAMKLYEEFERPTGWEQIGTYPKKSKAYSPETPWFFNQSCTEAVCLRRIAKEFDDGTGSSATEDAFDRYKATIAPDFVTVALLTPADPFVYTEHITKIHPWYHQPMDHYGYSHEWQEDHIKIAIQISGEQYVLGDYIEDKLIWGKIKYNITRNQVQYNTKGMDPPDYTVDINGTPTQISNRNMRVGPWYLDLYKYGYQPTYIPHEADHEYSTWLGHTEHIFLYYGPEDKPEDSYIELHRYRTGTSDEWAGDPRQENNPWLYFYQFYTRWMRAFIDLRALCFFSYDIEKYGLWQTDSNPHLVHSTKKHKDIVYLKTNTQGSAYTSYKESRAASVFFQWDLSVCDSMPESVDVTHTRNTYLAKWPSFNWTGTVTSPGSKTYYNQDMIGDLKASWPTVDELLYGKANECKGNGVATELDQLGFSVEVPDPLKEGKYVILSDMILGGKPDVIVGFGTKFYPVGTC